MLSPVLSKHQCDLIVTTGDADRSHLEDSGEFKKSKRRTHPLDFQRFAGPGSRRPRVVSQSPSLVSLSVRLLLLLPVVSAQAIPLQLTPTCAQTCLNYHHHIIFCLLFYQLLKQALSTLPERTSVLNMPSYLLHRCSRRLRTVLLRALVSGS